MKTTLHINGVPVTLGNVEKKAQEVRFSLNGTSYSFRARRADDGSFSLEEEPSPGIIASASASVWQSGKNTRIVQVGKLEARISETLPAASQAGGAAALSPLAPMPGLVRQVLVKKGQKVKSGEALVVLEAMKLQLTLSAGADAIVDAVLVTVGQLVGEGAELVKLTAKKS